MLDEIYEYANVPSGSQSSQAPLTPPISLPTTSSLQQLFPWLPTLPTIAPPSQPITTASPFFGQIGDENSGQGMLEDARPPADVAKDLLDANKLMRAFLRTMSKDANRIECIFLYFSPISSHLLASKAATSS